MNYADYKKNNPVGSVPQNVSQNGSDPSNLQGAIRRRLNKIPNTTPRPDRRTGGPTRLMPPPSKPSPTNVYG